MKTQIIIKTLGYRYSGNIISENDTELIIDDKILGKMTISKEQIAVRSDSE